MAIMRYLALTAGEFSACEAYPEHMAWMACHFSPYGTGLTNLPNALPEQSLLIVNDRTPICGHDPVLIRDTLDKIIQLQSCSGVLLDFQRPDCVETAALVRELLMLSCAVAVSEPYAQKLDCPVFLPPVPLNTTITDYLSPWIGREIWLEISLDALTYTVTPHGSTLSIPHCNDAAPYTHKDSFLHCHYRMEIQPDSCRFYLRRTPEDIDSLLEAAQSMGVTTAVGLYQELTADSEYF